MVVFVDSLIEYPEAWLEKRGIPSAKRNRHWCHMFVTEPDDVDLLHEMAETIGLKREWFQGDHYDLVRTKRALALMCGAVEATRDNQRAWIENFRRARRQDA